MKMVPFVIFIFVLDMMQCSKIEHHVNAGNETEQTATSGMKKTPGNEETKMNMGNPDVHTTHGGYEAVFLLLPVVLVTCSFLIFLLATTIIQCIQTLLKRDCCPSRGGEIQQTQLGHNDETKILFSKSAKQDEDIDKKKTEADKCCWEDEVLRYLAIISKEDKCCLLV